jgi:predicted DNA-binding protein with PD1-like motif
MKIKKGSNVLAIRLDEGEEVISSIKEAALSHDVNAGVIASFAGALKGCHLILGKGLDRSIQAHVEVSGNGNISMYEGNPHVHLHVAAGNYSGSWAGHLTDGIVDVFCEAFIIPVDLEMTRRYDKSLASSGVAVPYILEFG